MLVRSGLRCHCCFKLKHECEHRIAAILHANYRILSCKSLLSLGPLLGFLFCPGSPGPGPWWLNLEPLCSRHSILATPGIFSHGCTCVRCEAGTGKVVSTPGGSPVLPPASISACRQPEHGRNQQASQVTQHDRSPPGQLGPHVCTHADKSLAAIAYTQQTSCTWEPAFDSRQNFRAEPCQRPVRTWRGTSRQMTSRLSPWCPSPSNRSRQWKGGLQSSRSRSNPMRSKNHRPRSPGSMLMGQPVRGFLDRQAPYRETAPLGVQRCGRHSQDSSSLDFMVARTPSSELFRHGLAVSAPWTIATAPRLQNDCECSARTSLHQQPPIILASAIRPYTLPGQVPPGRTTNIHSRGKVVSTPGLDLRVPCMQLSPSFRWVRTGRPGKQESGARGQEAGSALAGIKMTQRREKLISHALSRILRHEAQDHDLPMNSAGYVPILDVVTVQSLWNHQVSPEEVHHAAQINKKQRFEIQTVNGVACIRAVQGHDQRLAAFYNLSDSEMLQLLELPRAPRYAIHGTMLKHYDAIKEGGLCRRQRRHIHFIEDTNAAEARIEDREASGLRAGSEIMLWVDILQSSKWGATVPWPRRLDLTLVYPLGPGDILRTICGSGRRPASTHIKGGAGCH